MQPVAEIRSQLRSDGLRAQRRLPAEWQVNCARDECGHESTTGSMFLAKLDVELLRGSNPLVGRPTYLKVRQAGDPSTS